MTPTARRTHEAAADEAEPPSTALRVLVADQAGGAVDPRRIEAAVLAALAESPYSQGAVSVAVVDDAAIHRLNRQFLDHDWPTDVLTFPLVDDPPRLEGEIVVSLETAAAAAAEAGWSCDDELVLYVVHGALHLAGFDDQRPSDEAAMRRREAGVVDRLGVRRSPSDPRWADLAADSSQESAAP
jgi:probable rRNA maturation factor